MGAGIKGLPLEKYVQDETLIVNALRILDDFFELDGLPCYADTALLAEALGCSLEWNGGSPEIKPLPGIVEDLEERIENVIDYPRVQVCLKVVRTLSNLVPHKVLMVVLPGSLTLAGQVTGWNAQDILNEPGLLNTVAGANLAILKALGNERIDMVIFREESPCGDNSLGLLAKSYESLWNLSRHYDVHTLLMLEGVPDKNVNGLKELMDRLILPLDTIGELKRNMHKRVSVALPNRLFMQTTDELKGMLTREEIFQQEKEGVFFVTNSEELSRETDKDLLVGGVRLVRDFIRTTAQDDFR